MTSQAYTPKKSPGRPPKKAPAKQSAPEPHMEPPQVQQAAEAPQKPAAASKKTSAELARERYEKRRALQKASNARDGDKLWTPDIPGFIKRWVVDEGGRVDEMQNKGYFIADKKDFPELDGVLSNTDEGTQVSFLVTAKNGEPTRQYLMLCAEDIYAERQSEKENRRQKVEQSLVRAKGEKGLGFEVDSSGKSVAYNPTKGGNAFEV